MLRGTLLFVIVFSPLLIQLFFPMDYFNYRAWEALRFDRLGSEKPFYTNRHLEKVEEGDLAYRTPYAVKKKVIWQTDKYGFRNYPSDDDQYDVVLIGDSNMVGSGVSQENTLASVLSRKTNLRVYSYASNNVNSNINKVLAEERFRKHPQKVIIVESIERHIQDLPAFEENFTSKRSVVRLSLFEKPIEKLDSLLKMSSIRYGVAIAKEKIKPRSIIVNPDTKMVFYKLALDNQQFNIKYFDRSVKNLIEYDNVLNRKGIKFIFLPIPDKETIYYSDIPEEYGMFRKESPFLENFIRVLEQNNVTVINTLENFKRNKQKGLFFLDDTHWNEKAVNMTADLIVKEIEVMAVNDFRSDALLVDQWVWTQFKQHSPYTEPLAAVSNQPN